MTCSNDGHSRASDGSLRPRRFRRVSWRALVLVAVLTAAMQPRIASAVFDMTGNWYIAAGDFGPVTLAQFTQTGMTLQVMISGAPMNGSGTIDPMTGEFTVTIYFPPPGCGGTFHGFLDPSGNTFVAPGGVAFTDPNCQGGIFTCGCMAMMAADLSGSRAPCGNGTVDGGEQCDDGNLGRNGDCCALGCIGVPAGTACASDGNACTSDVCDGAGACAHPNEPDGTGCSDGLFCNGQETTCLSGSCQTGTPPCPLLCDEPTDACVTGCPSTSQTCGAAQKSLFLAKNLGAANDKLVWKWLKGVATTQTEFGDPTATTDYALCVYDGSGLLSQTVVSAGTNWSVLGTSGYTYKDPAASGPALDRVQLKGSDDNKSKVLVKNKGGTLPGLPPSVTAPLTVQLFNGTTGLCWGATFTSQQLLDNAAGHIKAKAP
jgi:hypothetical protein